MLEFIKQPWHWAVSGSIIGLIIPLLLILGNKKFGISSSLRHICASCVPAKVPFFKYDWKKEIWNLFFVGGIFLGGFLANNFLTNSETLQIADITKTRLLEYGIQNFQGLMPVEIFSIENIITFKGLIFFVLGGFLVGFGTRYAGGCTSGHTIMGLSNLQMPSLIATINFLIGGLFSANILLPWLIKLFLN